MIKMIYSEFIKDTGHSIVVIKTEIGEFCGEAQAHPEESRISSFAGCSLAEKRAIAKYFKAKVKICNEKIKAIEDLQNTLKSYKEYNEQNFENRKIRKYLYLLKKQAAVYDAKRQKIYERISNDIAQRDKILNRHDLKKGRQISDE